MRKTFFISRFEEPRSENLMNLNGRPDDLLRQSVYKLPLRPPRLRGEISEILFTSETQHGYAATKGGKDTIEAQNSPSKILKFEFF
jgi:hypothetical protein